MVIKEILAKIDYVDFTGNIDYKVNNITYNSKKADSKTIFAAIRGFKQDGHLFIDDAKKNGCKVILCEEIVQPEEGISYILVKNTRISMADVSFLLKKPNDNINIIGVTGTNGKTSITYLLKTIYDYNDKKSGVIGSMGVVIGDKRKPLDNTTPESPDLHDLINKMKSNKIDNCFMEVSSHSTELFRVNNLKFKVGIFTNLTEDHLILHKTMENYYQAKKKFFYQCDCCIINIDDDYGYRMYNELTSEGLNTISYSSVKKSDYIIEDIYINKEGSKFLLKTPGKAYQVNLKTPGLFSIFNNVGAIITANQEGIEIENCIEALEQYNGVEGRFEFIQTRLDCTIIVDFAHTPDGLERVMEAINQFATGRKVVLFGAQGERDKARRSKMGEVAGKYCDLVILTADNPVNEDPIEICKEIIRGVEKYHKNYIIIIDREEAVHYLIKNYCSNDTILLAGKSTEYYQMVKDEKIPYFEKEVALQAINEMEATLEK